MFYAERYVYMPNGAKLNQLLSFPSKRGRDVLVEKDPDLRFIDSVDSRRKKLLGPAYLVNREGVSFKLHPVLPDNRVTYYSHTECIWFATIAFTKAGLIPTTDGLLAAALEACELQAGDIHPKQILKYLIKHAIPAGERPGWLSAIFVNEDHEAP